MHLIGGWVALAGAIEEDERSVEAAVSPKNSAQGEPRRRGWREERRLRREAEDVPAAALIDATQSPDRESVRVPINCRRWWPMVDECG